MLKVSFEPLGKVISDKDLIFVKYMAVWILLCVRTSFMLDNVKTCTSPFKEKKKKELNCVQT